MNNKTLLGIGVAAVVVIGSVLLLKGQPATKMNTAVSPTDSISVPTETVVSPTQETTMSKEVTITAGTNGYEPSTVTVPVGTKVTWVNKSGDTSNVSSDKHPTHLLYPPLNLGSFGDGESVSLVFDTKGTFTYHNHLDASQTGTVVVQ